MYPKSKLVRVNNPSQKKMEDLQRLREGGGQCISTEPETTKSPANRRWRRESNPRPKLMGVSFYVRILELSFPVRPGDLPDTWGCWRYPQKRIWLFIAPSTLIIEASCPTACTIVTPLCSGNNRFR
jgi:hypothetical protein